jgi:hypothetical protein
VAAVAAAVAAAAEAAAAVELEAEAEAGAKAYKAEGVVTVVMTRGMTRQRSVHMGSGGTSAHSQTEEACNMD